MKRMQLLWKNSFYETERKSHITLVLEAHRRALNKYVNIIYE